MKRKARYVSIILLVLLLITALSLGCKAKASSTTTATQTATIQKGTLSIDVSASGNLALSQTADLAFDVSGYVYKVAVEVGDPVKKGDVMAEVDTFDWEQQKRSLERALVQAKISLNSAIISLEKAQNPTTTTSTISGAISAPDPLDIESKQFQVEQARMSLEDAQQTLDRYLETSPQIVAPFDGFVTKVNVKGGDEVFKGAIAVSIADPTKFEANILVNEMDINRITLDMPATVQVTASPTSTFPAKVTAIAPTATNQSGVVNYQVKVELLSAEEIRQLRASQAQAGGQAQPGQSTTGQQGQTSRPPTGQTPGGQSSTGGSSATGQRQSGQFSGQGTGRTGQTGSTAALTLEQLRDGLSVTITVVIQQKQNVVMVPNRAITRSGGQTTVQVLKGDTPEERIIKTGIANVTYTEVTEGLSEGDKVVLPQATTTTSTQQSSQGQTFRIPGLGGPPGGPPR